MRAINHCGKKSRTNQSLARETNVETQDDKGLFELLLHIWCDNLTFLPLCKDARYLNKCSCITQETGIKRQANCKQYIVQHPSIRWEVNDQAQFSRFKQLAIVRKQKVAHTCDTKKIWKQSCLN